MRIYRYRLPLRAPVEMKGHVLTRREGLLLLDGDRWAEASPLPGFSRETLTEALDAMHAADRPNPPASVAFARSSLQTNWLPCRVPLNALLSGTRMQVLTRARELGDGPYRAVKLKVGRTPDVNDDIRLTEHVRRLLRDDQGLRLDANQAWDLATAVAFGREFQEQSIEYIEEPLREPAQLEVFHARTGMAYALDETLSTLESVDAFPNAAALVIKPTLIGARARLLRVAASGKKLVFSGSFESGIGVARIAQWAAEFSPGIPAGLETYDWLNEDVLQTRHKICDGELLICDRPRIRTSLLEEVWR